MPVHTEVTVWQSIRNLLFDYLYGIKYFPEIPI